METNIDDVVEQCILMQGVGKTSGKPYYMIVIKLDGDIEFRYLCQKGEENVIKALKQASQKKA